MVLTVIKAAFHEQFGSVSKGARLQKKKGQKKIKSSLLLSKE